ncbi:MAG: type II secretion system F family protein [Thermodesulfobacteriota bacterium]
MLRPLVEEKPAFLSADLIKKLENHLNLGKDSTRIKELQKRLIQAGIYNDRAIPVFFGVKLGLLLVLPMVVLFFWWGETDRRGLLIAGSIGLLTLGYILPDLILDHLVKARQQKIREALPDALDLMVVCVEAGQGLNAAIKRVSDDLMASSPIMARELLMVNLEIMAGLEREQALKNLGERTGVDELISLCTILIQSDRFGTSIAQALKTQSDFMRTSRRKKLEELAAKTPVKLVFPLLLFIFPAIIVVVLGPAVIRISEFFSSSPK